MVTTATVLLLAALLSVPAASKEVAVSTAEGLRQALRAARPGTRIHVAPGDYRGSIGAAGVHGTAEHPITIAAANPARPPVFRGGNECLHFSAVSHLILRDLVLTGAEINCLNIDAGGTRRPPSHHIVLDGLAVSDIALEGNRDGIKLFGVEDFLIRGCTVERWGSGGSAIDLVACRRGIITDCRFRHTGGRGATGVQIKGASSGVLVFRNHFRSAGQRAINLGGCTALNCFLTDTPTYEARELAAIGNVLIGSRAAISFVGSEQCTAAYNTILRPAAWAARILQEGRRPEFIPCRNSSFRGNLVVWRWRELRTAVDVRSRTQPETFRFDGNWWYCADRPAESRPILPVPDANAVIGRDPGLVVKGLAITAHAAPNHGAHAPRAAELFGQLGPKLAPWAFQSLRSLDSHAADPSRQPPKGATE